MDKAWIYHRDRCFIEEADLDNARAIDSVILEIADKVNGSHRSYGGILGHSKHGLNQDMLEGNRRRTAATMFGYFARVLGWHDENEVKQNQETLRRLVSEYSLDDVDLRHYQEIKDQLVELPKQKPEGDDPESRRIRGAFAYAHSMARWAIEHHGHWIEKIVVPKVVALPGKLEQAGKREALYAGTDIAGNPYMTLLSGMTSFATAPFDADDTGEFGTMQKAGYFHQVFLDKMGKVLQAGPLDTVEPLAETIEIAAGLSSDRIRPANPQILIRSIKEATGRK